MNINQKIIFIIFIIILCSPNLILAQDEDKNNSIFSYFGVEVAYGISSFGASFNVPIGSTTEQINKSSYSGFVVGANTGIRIMDTIDLSISATFNTTYIPFTDLATGFTSPQGNAGKFYGMGVQVGLGFRFNSGIVGPFNVFDREKPIFTSPQMMFYSTLEFRLSFPIDSKISSSDGAATAFYTHNQMVGVGATLEGGVVFFLFKNFGLAPLVSYTLAIVKPNSLTVDGVTTEYNPRNNVVHGVLTIGLNVIFLFN